MKSLLKFNIFKGEHKPRLTAMDFFKYIGPGLLVTVGFIDPGNWASNVSAGANFGYILLWMVTLSTIMLIILQHNAAHLGIVTGDCLSEAATKNIKPVIKNIILITAVAASISTALAELLGGAIALNMLFKIPIKLGTIIMLLLIVWMLFTNSYKKLERWIIGFVSIIGISFIFELTLVHVDWKSAVTGWVTPSFPENSMPVIMSVLGAVVMPHNLFLHSEIIQSRQWNLKDESVIKKQLKYEFADTLFSMIIGWAINSAMILLAASTFFVNHVEVTELSQAQEMLKPLLGSGASIIFALALLFAGISSTVTAGMAGGSIFAGIYGEPYDISDSHTKVGVFITLILAALVIFFIRDPFRGLVYSQMFLSVQLPITIFTQIYLTSSKKVMGKFVNSIIDKILLWVIGIIVTILNIALLISYF
ncbi:divalent metal cation transporter MntH [Clostridium pasteurianum DSM 525 = ATCC 6013]|uniref:Divalent metal cation transporter MntH n=1 Tax=Clostridium pasteurianum DSM 525 = ATCC 6013 TaxID=1262449 RepID=A0A0H3IZB6_CLOPA|nr:Nramp family divalent metal transporter [Clostridium pasteurianum]AJA46374.1 divalent metal cation transporter MntH [Clostridium pasteurianum DSM 525 = ATCC 6013]AJA50362.1 divalent metal cation transporter MntH [Clostridium pasteurianum DSM 525 = ATCC 6013]AOZ73811.1 Mg2+/Co2+ transporter [Clostridium pasteurianum DSM 525 = ATCC 6013]AOZ77608.1 Mg2+/Co2+ transporter [Clostridium pasteurianum]ELP60949.1 Putative Mn transporter, NRAMR family protein [Clostridium pasteurianum DSM 525 = ATCC 6